MLAIDTNVVLRLLIRDHPAQTAVAESLIRDFDVAVSNTVVLETAWVLRTRYGFTNATVVQALTALAGVPRVYLTDGDAFVTTLSGVEAGLDFADALHLAQARDLDGFATFDRKFAKVAARVTNVPIRRL